MHQVLARKWRPKNFQAVVGQEHVLTALSNALSQQRIHHAYLFTGTRGVGKTSIARILAKCLNCETGPTATPCNHCACCQMIDEGRFLDLIEVDAASRTKVEDTRELLDNIQYAPVQGRYKVYLIDEVHMLSGHSFNALLKTLEEPPSHIIFLLATTDPQKLPITVLSRCLQFNLRALPPEKITHQLKHVLNEEKISFTETSVQLLAKSASGSMRDALSLLDQAIAYSDGNLSEDAVRTMLGCVAQNQIVPLVQSLIANDIQALFAQIQQLADFAIDFMQALDEFLSIMHKLAIRQKIPAETATLDADEEILTKLAAQISCEDIQLFYQIALIGRRDLPLAPSAKIGFEMIMLRALTFKPVLSDHNLGTSNKPLLRAAPPEAAKISANNQETNPRPQPTAKTSVDYPSIENNPKQTQIKTIAAITNNREWIELIPKLKLSGFTQVLANHCAFIKMTGTEIHFILDPAHAPLLNENQKKLLETQLSAYFEKPHKVLIQTGQTTLETPAALQKRENQENRDAALKNMESSNTVNDLLNTFGGTLVKESIEVNK